MNPWAIATAILGGLLLLWLTLVFALWLVARREGKRVNLRDMLRLIPDLVRLLHGLARDPAIPRGVRIGLGALLVYLAVPIDLIPDFIPVVGYADDIVLVAVVLRSVARHAGPEAIDRHWPGTPEGLLAIKTLTGYSSPAK
ncbi:YkvA family protein [Pengzhenrongella phosphoraccumulans]|uniref:YkvA family protein n=1 Tax=Pengzhenrongella phosphoraccumulans TaxID=3114394 RepID=UPI0038901F29